MLGMASSWCTRSRAAVILGVCAMLAAGCTTSTDEGVEDLPARAGRSGFPAGVGHLDGLRGMQVIDAQLLASSAREAGLAPAQVEAFTDGIVDFAEYEQLYREFVDCTAARSIVIHDRGLIHNDILGIGLFVYGLPDGSEGEVAECATRHVFAAEQLYRAQNQRPLDQQEALIDRRFHALYDCFIEQGAQLAFPVDEVRDHEHEMLSLMDTYPICGSPY
jgi:hypothetical protein